MLHQEIDDLVYRAVKRALSDNKDISIQTLRDGHNDAEIRDDIMEFLKSL